MSCVLVKMLHILVLCPVLLIGGVQTLTIDSQLGTSIEDCFERISIGEQLPSSAIYRNVTELTTSECEQICKQDKQCQTYDYGVGAKGNATCELSMQSEKEVKDGSLSRHPDYDVFARRLQCEQAPPRPLQLADDIEGPASNNRPQHRPVFRPDVDDRPLTGDYLISSDIDPYNLGSKPQSYRPDDISQRPAFDVGPSYGDHKPQDMSYPERPRPPRPYRPQSDPYRPTHGSYKPNRPQDSYTPNRPEDSYRPQSDPYQKPKPESNDVLHFGYEKPMDKPDLNRPELPDYNYIIRPNRKPKPNDHYLGSYRPGQPTYSYNTQYASNYGQNQNDNSVYVEIYDPPRPYVPIKDRPIQHNYDQGFLGYGTYSSQNSYTHNSQNSQNLYTGSITEIYDKQKPYDGRPNRPNQYGQNDDQSSDYQRPNGRPNDKYKPQGNQNSYGNHNSYNSNQLYQESYGSQSQSQSSYGENRPYQEQRPQKPSYNKPSYNDDKGDYGSNQGSYGSGQGSYGGNHGTNHGSQSSHNSFQGQGSYSQGQSYNSQGFGSQDYGSQGYGGNQATYEGNQISNGGSHGSYGGNHGSYGSYDAHGSYSSSGYGNRPVFDYETHKPGYGNENPAYNHHKPSYGSSKPDYDSQKPGYGQKPEYDRPKPGYDNPRPGYGQTPEYDRPKPGYDSPRPGYGQNPEYDRPKPGYDSPRPGYDSPRPGYGQNPESDSLKPGYGQTPEYNSPKPGYGSSTPDYEPKPGYNSPKPGYDSPKPGYGQTPDYNSPKPGYGSSDTDNDPKPGYGSEKPEDSPKPGYGSQKPDYNRPKPGYGNERPDPDYERPSGNQKPGYGVEKPEDIGYGTGQNVKPVYEYELDKPTNVPTYITRPGGEIVTSRPVVIGDYEHPVYKDPGTSYAAKTSLLNAKIKAV